MRPTLDWNPGIDDSRANQASARGTPLPKADTGSFEDFFRAGDEGRYEGGPAEFEPLELEEPEPLKIIVRTPEQVARRARFIKAVSGVVGCFAAITAVALLRSSPATASVPVDARPAVVAAPAKPSVVAAKPMVAAAPKPAAAVEQPKVEPAPPPSVEPILPDVASAKVAPASEPAVKRSAEPPAIVASRARSVDRTAPEPEPEPAPAPAPAPAPVTPSGPPPTAAFPAM